METLENWGYNFMVWGNEHYILVHLLVLCVILVIAGVMLARINRINRFVDDPSMPALPPTATVPRRMMGTEKK